MGLHYWKNFLVHGHDHPSWNHQEQQVKNDDRIRCHHSFLPPPLVEVQMWDMSVFDDRMEANLKKTMNTSCGVCRIADRSQGSC